ncbi:hypothetical protein [uncultured Marinobacter sp.]|uniref:hypothetical protein n=1 Tax=uncultured Marinobacter sp. TaxID=187379 RepID=UPI002595606A|nr:hypothetical protein [uncultured Marinobacter sp.]
MLKSPRLRVGGLLVLAVVVLSGCKVSATSGDRYYDEPSYSRGYFLDARDTGRYFPNESWSLNHEAEVCNGETLYFETADGRVRVYGSSAYSENTFRAAATELNTRIDGVLNRFKMTWRDFVDERSAEAPYPERIVGCLSSRVTNANLASGTLAAVAIAPYHRNWPYEAGQIFTHELAHYVQENLSRYSAAVPLLPYWFAEGQAALVAGDPVAPAYQHYDYSPLRDATRSEAGNVSYRFEHYALAYRYLEQANGALTMTLLLDLVQYMDWTGDYRGVISTGESRAFVEAFDAMELVDHRGRYLSFGRFFADYHALVSDWR